MERCAALRATPGGGPQSERRLDRLHLRGRLHRGSSAVDVSTDGGATWKSATPSSPKSDLTWVLWTLDWTPPRSGSFRIVARAVDAAGTPQDSNPAPTFPEGSACYDSITLLVS